MRRSSNISHSHFHIRAGFLQLNSLLVAFVMVFIFCPGSMASAESSTGVERADYEAKVINDQLVGSFEFKLGSERIVEQHSELGKSNLSVGAMSANGRRIPWRVDADGVVSASSGGSETISGRWSLISANDEKDTFSVELFPAKVNVLSILLPSEVELSSSNGYVEASPPNRNGEKIWSVNLGNANETQLSLAPAVVEELMDSSLLVGGTANTHVSSRGELGLIADLRIEVVGKSISSIGFDVPFKFVVTSIAYGKEQIPFSTARQGDIRHVVVHFNEPVSGVLRPLSIQVQGLISFQERTNYLLMLPRDCEVGDYRWTMTTDEDVELAELAWDQCRPLSLPDQEESFAVQVLNRDAEISSILKRETVPAQTSVQHEMRYEGRTLLYDVTATFEGNSDFQIAQIIRVPEFWKVIDVAFLQACRDSEDSRLTCFWDESVSRGMRKLSVFIPDKCGLPAGGVLKLSLQANVDDCRSEPEVTFPLWDVTAEVFRLKNGSIEEHLLDPASGPRQRMLYEGDSYTDLMQYALVGAKEKPVISVRALPNPEGWDVVFDINSEITSTNRELAILLPGIEPSQVTWSTPPAVVLLAEEQSGLNQDAQSATVVMLQRRPGDTAPIAVSGRYFLPRSNQTKLTLPGIALPDDLGKVSPLKVTGSLVWNSPDHIGLSMYGPDSNQQTFRHVENPDTVDDEAAQDETSLQLYEFVYEFARSCLVELIYPENAAGPSRPDVVVTEFYSATTQKILGYGLIVPATDATRIQFLNSETDSNRFVSREETLEGEDCIVAFSEDLNLVVAGLRNSFGDKAVLFDRMEVGGAGDVNLNLVFAEAMAQMEQAIDASENGTGQILSLGSLAGSVSRNSVEERKATSLRLILLLIVVAGVGLGRIAYGQWKLTLAKSKMS
ncbi:hypothetical protein [Calycomorphotria hydatis]|uniref:Transmembrane protein n=1 Tax=Calycomorphotria hydatis TaxID=2528027 RepID=A0A517TAI1_9PLAN|nr:hypothetical protein [Calycomorphotria hydatis]QDT65374.1 hypothetical protein V22_26270 [Calycomorphotria hydatis]